jgi:hypothetical protein
VPFVTCWYIWVILVTVHGMNDIKHFQYYNIVLITLGKKKPSVGKSTL